MFSSATKKELQFLNNGVNVGLVRYNSSYSFQEKTTRPFIRNKGREVLILGRVNYALLDQFIIQSLNDYYNKISFVKNGKEREQKVLEYNTLYQLWYQVNQARQTNDIRLNSFYDDILYQ